MMDYRSYFFSLHKTDYNDELKYYNIHQIILWNFIKYYKVIDNNIVIYFSDGTLSVPYSKDLEIEILNKMKEQINNADIKYSKIFSHLYGTGCATLCLVIYNCFKAISENKLDYLNTAFPLFVVSLVFSSPFLIYSSKVYDATKHTLFLDNEEKINNSILEKMLESGMVREDTINTAPKFSSYLTINDVHFMSKGEVRNLVNGNVSEEMIYRLRKD